MLRKLLILMLVLGMASSAGAAVSLGGDTEVYLGGTATVTVISDDTSNWMGYIEFDPSKMGVSGCVATSNAGEDSYVIPDPLGWTGYYEIRAADDSAPYDSVQPGVQFEISVHGGSFDPYTINLYASDWATLLDSWTVYHGHPDCFPSAHPDYSEWVNVGKPECWCNPRQCHGDSDTYGVTPEGSTKAGYWYVGIHDLHYLVSAWKILEPAVPPTPSGPGIGYGDICADFDHAIEGSIKAGFWRVGLDDLNILVANWKILEPAVAPTPGGPGVPPDCRNVP